MPTFLWLLLGLWAATLAAAFIFGKYNADRTRYANRPALMATSGWLVVTAFAFWLGGARLGPFASFSLLVALGMTASFAGDLVLAEYLRAPHRIISGMLAFGVGHALYISAYLAAGRALGLPGGAALWAPMIGLVVIGVGLWFWLVRSAAAPSALNYGSLVYTVLIAGMTGLAIWLALDDPRLRPLALGSLLFLVSDAVLGNQLLRGNNWRHVHDVVWLLYAPGQALIVWSNWALM